MTIGDIPEQRCPHCGYCPHCGRSNQPYWPYYSQPYNPFRPWGGPTWTVTGTTTGIADATGQSVTNPQS